MVSELIKQFVDPQVVIAHRQELVTQLSLTLAESEIIHDLLVPDKLIKEISLLQVKAFGKSFINPWSKITVAGVDTILRRLEKPYFKRWVQSIRRWTVDEGHHVLKANKWGRVVTAFENATGLGVTATPTRTDGRGLGSLYDGVFDKLIIGPSMSSLMALGNLTPYRIFCVDPDDLDLSTVPVGKNGDYTKPAISKVIEKSTIMGDVVTHYLKYAPGIRGLTFCADIKTAQITTDKFIASGIPAMLVTASTPIGDRIEASRKLKSGELLQLVNVDIFGEGYDLPAVGCVSMLRPTKSLSLYLQHFGRALRPIAGKTHAIIFDHVGNVKQHGLPDTPRSWSLERHKKKSEASSIDIQVATCKTVGCFAPYDGRLPACPYCGTEKIKIPRASIKKIFGDLTELDLSVISELQTKKNEINNPPPPPMALHAGIKSVILKRQELRKTKQLELRTKISQWAGNLKFAGKTDSEIYKIFYSLTGTDVLTAQTLNASATVELMGKF